MQKIIFFIGFALVLTSSLQLQAQYAKQDCIYDIKFLSINSSGEVQVQLTDDARN